jgi:hypothetical protein
MRPRKPKPPPSALTPPPRSVMNPPPPQSPPKAPPAGQVPNPKRPRLVRDVGGGYLKDLFAMFPDLPRPPRPRARLPFRRTVRGSMR